MEEGEPRRERSMRGWGGVAVRYPVRIHLPEADNKAGSALAPRKQSSPPLRTLHMSPSPLLKATSFPTFFLSKHPSLVFLIIAKLGRLRSTR